MRLKHLKDWYGNKSQFWFTRHEDIYPTAIRDSVPSNYIQTLKYFLLCFSCMLARTNSSSEDGHALGSSLDEGLSTGAFFGLNFDTNRCKPNTSFIWCLPVDYNQEKHPFTCKLYLKFRISPFRVGKSQKGFWNQHLIVNFFLSKMWKFSTFKGWRFTLVAWIAR